jgi:hypothetical protein
VDVDRSAIDTNVVVLTTCVDVLTILVLRCVDLRARTGKKAQVISQENTRTGKYENWISNLSCSLLFNQSNTCKFEYRLELKFEVRESVFKQRNQILVLKLIRTPIRYLSHFCKQFRTSDLSIGYFRVKSSTSKFDYWSNLVVKFDN